MADFDPKSLKGDRRTIYLSLVASFGEEGAARLMESTERVSGSFRKAHEGAVKFEERLGKLSQMAGIVGNAMRSVGSAVNTFTSFINAGNISIKAGTDASMKYRDGIVATFSQFQKYGTTVKQHEANVEKLRKTYNLSYTDSIKLASSLEKSFNVTGPEKMDDYLKSIRNTVGSNIDSINEFRQSIESLTSSNPLLEKMVASLDFKGAERYARGLLLSGQIAKSQYKDFLQLKQSNSRSSSDKAALEELQKPVNTIRSLQSSVDKGMKLAGDDTLYVIQKTADLIGGVEKWGNSLSQVTRRYTEIQAVLGSILGMAGGLSGGLSQGLNFLDAYADYKILGGGKVLGKAGRLASKVAPTFSRWGATAGGAATGGLGYLSGVNSAGAGALFGGAGVGGAALSWGGVGAAAYGGLHYGNKIGNYLLVDTSNTIDRMGNSEEMGDRISGMANADSEAGLRLKLSALQAKGDKEKYETKNSLWGNTGGTVGEWMGISSGDSISKELQGEMNLIKQQLNTLEFKKKEIEAEKKAFEASLTDDDRRIQKLNDELLITENSLNRQRLVLESTSNLFNIQAEFAGKTGRNIESNLLGLNKVFDKNEQLAKLKVEDLRMQLAIDEKTHPGDPDEQLIDNLNKAETELLKITQARSDASEKFITQNKPQLEQNQRIKDLMQAHISLADNAGMGLRAQIGTRNELIKQITVEINLLGQQRALAENEILKLEEQKKYAKNATDLEQIESQIFDRKKNILDIDIKRTNAVKEQAEVSKSMREGWIGAISAMTTGAGVFSRIVIDQNKRLGNLQFAGPERLKTLRGGGTLGGRRESAQWTPGGFREGAAGAYENGVLGQYGLNSSNSLQGTAANVMNFQKNVGSKMSPAAAAFGVGPQGTAEVTDTKKEGFNKTGSGQNKFLIEEKEIKEIKKTLIDIFTKIGKEIETETIKRINSGR